MSGSQGGRRSSSTPDRDHQGAAEKRDQRHQCEVDQTHVLMEFHQPDVPGIRNLNGRLVHYGCGVHVDHEHAQKQGQRPTRNVSRGALGARILP